jgi:hypothetical protein
MTGENNQLFDPSALDRHTLDTRPPRFSWPLFAVQLWLLAVFVGMSLVAIAARDLITGASEGTLAVRLALGALGAAMTAAAWRGVARQANRAEREEAAGDGAALAGAKMSPAPPLVLAPHR